MLQNINMNADKPQLEGKDENMKSYLCYIATEYIQTRTGEVAKKRPGFWKNQ